MKQGVLDRRDRLTVDKLERQVEGMTEAQIQQNAVSEGEADIEPATVAGEAVEELSARPSSSARGAYLSIERALIDKLSACFGRSYRVLANRRVGAAEYDAVLAAYDDHTVDVIFEIKYARRGFGYGWISETAKRVVLSSELYAQLTGRANFPVVLVVAPRDVLAKKDVALYKERIYRDAEVSRSTLALHFLDEETIRDLSCDQLRSLLSV